MSKLFSNPAFQNSSKSKFNLAAAGNSFHSLFDTRDLNPEEKNKLETLLIENISNERCEIKDDLLHLNRITAEIKSIGRQGILLVGERVFKAKALLKPYKDGTFTRWLEFTFGNRKAGYNMLSYYELYTAIPTKLLKDKFYQMPLRAAYIISSRDIELEEKLALIEKCYNLKNEQIISFVQEAYSIEDKRGKQISTSLLKKLTHIVKDLEDVKLSKTELSQVRELQDKLSKLLKRI